MYTALSYSLCTVTYLKCTYCLTYRLCNIRIQWNSFRNPWCSLQNRMYGGSKLEWNSICVTTEQNWCHFVNYKFKLESRCLNAEWKFIETIPWLSNWQINHLYSVIWFGLPTIITLQENPDIKLVHYKCWLPNKSFILRNSIRVNDSNFMFGHAIQLTKYVAIDYFLLVA